METVELVDPEPNAMQVFVKTLGKVDVIPLRAHAHEGVEVLKKRLSLKLGIPPDILRLSHGRRVLEYDMKLVDYNIQKGSTLSLRLNLRG